MKIILASASPRRIELLKKITEDYEVISSTFDEDSIKNIESDPEKLVKILAESKAKAVFDEIQEKYSEVAVIGSDTMVSLDNELLGKPQTEENAKIMLKRIQNTVNDVFTGMSVILKVNEETKIITVSSKSSVIFKEMSDEDIDEYIATAEPLDKAGAYAIQGIGSKYISGYTGSFDNIVGLDTDMLRNILKENNIVD